MFGKGNTAVKLKEARDKLAATEASLANARSVVGRADAERDEIARRQHAGDLDENRAAEAFREVDERVRVQLADIPRLERIAALLEGEIAGVEEAEQAERYQAALEELAAADATVVAASADVGAVLRRAAQRGRRLAAVRAARDVMLQEALALRPEGADPLPRVDEPDWADKTERDQIRRLLADGPLQPNASAAAQAATAQRERERAEAEQIDVVVKGLVGLPSAELVAGEIERLPAHLRARAWQKARAQNAHARALAEERDRRERERKPERVLR